MRSESIALLDIRSQNITAVVGERGVNNTFIIKSKYTCDYDGYMDSELLDVPNFVSAVQRAIKSTLSPLSNVKQFYVGIPGEFLKLQNCESVLSFTSSRKITEKDLKILLEMATPPREEGYKLIRHGNIFYTLSDKRKTVDPVGSVGDSVQGKFCFYKCKSAFIDILMRAFSPFQNISSVKVLPSVHAEAIYLIEPEKRDKIALLFDLGYISSSFSVVCGNGLLFSESFSVGVGHIAYKLASELEIPYPLAETFLKTVNLNSKDRLTSLVECEYDDKTYSFSSSILKEKIKDGLDGICETIETCIQSYTGTSLDGKPLYITGDMVKTIRGTIEHLSGRLLRPVECVVPRIPYYDKPQFGSLLSLLDLALIDSVSK